MPTLASPIHTGAHGMTLRTKKRNPSKDPQGSPGGEIKRGKGRTLNNTGHTRPTHPTIPLPLPPNLTIEQAKMVVKQLNIPFRAMCLNAYGPGMY